MDIDMKAKANGDLDLESLLQQFSCLATQDKDVLINQFKTFLSPNHLSLEGCAFFLDMNNWNLQQAICSYFDFGAPKEKDLYLEPLLKMSLVKDVTIGEGEEVPPATKFIKTWKLQNSGTERWPPGCTLKHISGYLMCFCDRLIVDPLEPGQVIDISVEMLSPLQAGIYESRWRMCTATGQFFGEVIWVIVSVAEGGLLSLMQQFRHLGSPVEHECNEATTNQNPFASKPKYSSMCEDSLTDCHLPQPQSNEANLISNNLAPNFITDVHQPLLNSPKDNHEESIPISNSHSNNHCSLATNESKLSKANNHLPPTPPPSEDMML